MTVSFPCVIDGSLKTVFVRGYHINPDSGEATSDLEWEDEYGKRVNHSVPINSDDVTTYFPIAAVQANIAAASDAGMVDRFRVTSERIVFDLWNSGVLTDAGNPNTYTVTTTRASIAKNIWTGEELAVNAPCRRKIFMGGTGIEIYEYANFSAYTRINDADLKNWSITGTSVVADGSLLDDSYSMSMNPGDTVYENRVITNAIKHYFGFRVRKISGDATGLTAKLIRTSVPATVWGTINLSAITDAWSWVGVESSAVSATDGTLIFTAANAVSFEVQYVQLTAGIAATAHRLPFIPGVGAGVVHAATNILSTSPATQGAQAYIARFAMYRHNLANTLQLYPPIFLGGTYCACQREANNLNPNIGGARPLVPIATMLADTVRVIALDWERPVENVCDHYLDGSFVSQAAMTTNFNYAGVHLGRNNTGTRWLNGEVSLIRANQRLSPSVHAAISYCLSPGTVVTYRA